MSLFDDAVSVFGAAVEAADPRGAVERHLRVEHGEAADIDLIDQSPRGELWGLR